MYISAAYSTGFHFHGSSVYTRGGVFRNSDGNPNRLCLIGRQVKRLQRRQRIGIPTGGLADPFAGDPSLVATPDQREVVTLERGALRGVVAQLATPTLGVPHLWAFHDGLMITVAGDLTRDQLLTVANSLEPLK